MFLALLFISSGGCNPVGKIPSPITKSAEFHFKLEYELNGKLIIVSDVLVCEYKGISYNSSVGWHRVYDKHLASNKKKKDIQLLELEDGLKLYYYTGYPAYYLGDSIVKNVDEFNTVYSSKNDDRSSGSEKIYNNKTYEDFGIKLINWSIDSPIENSFK